MEVTLFGKTILVREPQFRNTLSSMAVMAAGSVTLARELQELKAD